MGNICSMREASKSLPKIELSSFNSTSFVYRGREDQRCETIDRAPVQAQRSYLQYLPGRFSCTYPYLTQKKVFCADVHRLVKIDSKTIEYAQKHRPGNYHKNIRNVWDALHVRSSLQLHGPFASSLLIRGLLNIAPGEKSLHIYWEPLFPPGRGRPFKFRGCSVRGRRSHLFWTKCF